MRFNVLLIAVLLMSVGCRKYKEATGPSNPAYIRVFNDITTPINFMNSSNASSFLTLIIDPHMDASEAPDTGYVVGDWLGTRQLYSLSIPTNEGNALGTPYQQISQGYTFVNDQYVNYEYPGNQHVLTAPPMNGFDLSSWAQVSSGMHRFIFVIRPQSDTAFSRLSTTIRHQIVIDTTVDLEPGEVYTLEALSLNLDQNQYGMYVRQEQFVHQSFAPDQLYVGFVNLSGVKPQAAQYGYTPDFNDTTAIYYSYYTAVDEINAPPPNTQLTYTCLPGYKNLYYTTLTKRLNTDISFLALPLLDSSYFFQQDTLRSYASTLENSSNTTNGTLPYVSFSFNPADSLEFTGNYFYPFILNCAANPITFNNYVPGVGVTLNYAPNLDLIFNEGGQYHIYPTLNIMEMVYDRVFMMQIQYAINQDPN